MGTHGKSKAALKAEAFGSAIFFSALYLGAVMAVIAAAFTTSIGATGILLFLAVLLVGVGSILLCGFDHAVHELDRRERLHVRGLHDDAA